MSSSPESHASFVAASAPITTSHAAAYASPYLGTSPRDSVASAHTLASILNAPARAAAVAVPASSQVAAAKPRRRRPRTAIHLPAEDTSKLDKEELRKIKNRIAAARARERSNQRVQELEAVIRELWNRVQYVEGVVLDLQPNLTLRELYSGYQPQVQLSPSTLTSPTGAFQAPNATFDLRELAWMFASTEPHSN